jgi:hypothetical protein
MQATTDDSGGRVKSWENLLTETSRDKPEFKKGEGHGSEQKQQEVWERAKEMATLLPQHLRPRNCTRATRKEEEPMMHEDFVQIHDVSSPLEKEAVKHKKPY